MPRYEQFAALTPPRPEKAIPKGMLPMFEAMGHVAQFKKNGTYSVVYVSPEKRVTALTRHKDEHKAWTGFNESARDTFASLPGKGWYVVCCELLHSKVAGVRDTHYIHDVIVEDGEWLIGTTYMQRYSRLMSLFHKRPTETTTSHWVLSPGMWLARNHKSNFRGLFESITSPEDEGLVVKNPTAVLAAKDSRFSVKCRYPHKNYAF